MYNYFQIIGKLKTFDIEHQELIMEMIPDFPNQYGERKPYKLVVFLPDSVFGIVKDKIVEDKMIAIKGRMVEQGIFCSLWAERVMFMESDKE